MVKGSYSKAIIDINYENTDFNNFFKYMSLLPNCKLLGDSKIKAISLLAPIVDQLHTNSDKFLVAENLQRVNAVQWKKPLLSFVIKSSVARRNGSGRLYEHHWCINTVTRKAGVSVKYQQVQPKSAPYTSHHASADAEIAAEAILSQNWESPLIKQLKDGRTHLLIKNLLPDACTEETTNQQRRKLREALKKRIAPQGWVENTPNYWSKPH